MLHQSSIKLTQSGKGQTCYALKSVSYASISFILNAGKYKSDRYCNIIPIELQSGFLLEQIVFKLTNFYFDDGFTFPFKVNANKTTFAEK